MSGSESDADDLPETSKYIYSGIASMSILPPLDEAAKKLRRYPFVCTAPIMSVGQNGIPFVFSTPDAPMQPLLVRPTRDQYQNFTAFSNLPGNLDSANSMLQCLRFRAYCEAWRYYPDKYDEPLLCFSLHCKATCKRLYAVEGSWTQKGSAIEVPGIEHLFWVACWERHNRLHEFEHREAYLRGLVEGAMRREVEREGKEKVSAAEVDEMTNAMRLVDVDPDGKFDGLMASLAGLGFATH